MSNFPFETFIEIWREIMLPQMAEGNQQEKITYSKIGRVEGPGSLECEGANVLPSLSSPSLLCQRPPPFSLLLPNFAGNSRSADIIRL